ncbi:uncharacterized protein [Eleutherodactylus coqui]|uniref:uncharacterized protein n=1 Tax=Eleutherodactylus coqui TaxID=57060 RepID=UPI0034618AE1
MTMVEKMALLLRFTFLAVVLANEAYTQLSSSSDFIISSCRRSLVQLDLPAQYVIRNYVRFSAVDENGAAHVISDSLATQCGYTISYNDWGDITFRTSLYSCYTQIMNDTYYTISVKVEISTRRDMGNAVSYMKVVSCPYVWSPREMICETNYMEVSVRRKIPVISEGVFRNEPEDWSTAFTQAVSGLMSVWQIVFHLSTTQKTTMLIDAAQSLGYGINTTESRILLRTPYNATQAIAQRIGGVTFSTVRATLFYKQRWFIFLVDNAVACPLDDVMFVNGWIVWTVPKNLSPLLTGAKIIQNSRIQFGVDLLNLTDDEILARNYDILDRNTVTVTRIPVGAVGGYYKSHSVDFQHGITYTIRPFLENMWVDDAWGVSKYTIIKDITTPFEPKPPVLTNETIPSTLTFNITVGTFLPDVQLVNLTINGVVLTVPQAVNLGCNIQNKTHANGSVNFVLKIPFGDDRVIKEVTSTGYVVTLPISIKDQYGNDLHSIMVSCDTPPNPPVCYPDGKIQVSVKKINNIPNMDLSRLSLMDRKCGPVSSDGITAQFTFTVNSCSTTRRFEGNMMIYENQISYVSAITGKVLFIMKVACNYTTNTTLVVDYIPTENPPPSLQTGFAPLDLVLRLSKGVDYSVFYEDPEYPVVKYLREPLYFEIELLYSSDPQLELFLDSCWATTSPDMRSLPAWPIIDNSCEHNEPYQTIFHSVMADARVQFPSHLKRFEVKTFTFMDGDITYTGEIYFHCDVIICGSNLGSDPACTQIGSCIPARQRLGRSVNTDYHRRISSRAVFLFASERNIDTKRFPNHQLLQDVHF